MIKQTTLQTTMCFFKLLYLKFKLSFVSAWWRCWSLSLYLTCSHDSNWIAISSLFSCFILRFSVSFINCFVLNDIYLSLSFTLWYVTEIWEKKESQMCCSSFRKYKTTDSVCVDETGCHCAFKHTVQLLLVCDKHLFGIRVLLHVICSSSWYIFIKVEK